MESSISAYSDDSPKRLYQYDLSTRQKKNKGLSQGAQLLLYSAVIKGEPDTARQ